MKRVLFIVLISLFLSGCTSPTWNVREIEALNLQNGEKTILSKNDENANIILNAINKKVETDEEFTSLSDYQIKLKKNNNSEVYTLSFDLENESVFLSQSDKRYKVKDKAAKELLLSDFFSYMYVEATVYDAFVDLNGKKFSPHIEYSWTGSNIEGHYINESGKLDEKYEKIDKLYISQIDLIDIKFEKTPDFQSIRVYSGDRLVSSGRNLKDALASIKTDGEYSIECQSQWHLKEGSNSYGNQTLSFTTFIDRPAEINIVTRENFPGNILLISVDNLNHDESIRIETELVKIESDIYPYKGKNYFICPIDLDAKPGEYELKAIVNSGKEDEYIIEETLTIESKSFKTQYLIVSEEINETNNNDMAIDEFLDLVKPARTVSTKEKLWDGTFIMPVEGVLTTDFAEIRYVNDDSSSSRHSGLDLAAPTGTPIKAANNGIVVFAMEGLLSPGNTLVIDHGLGLFTSYYHLHTIDVKEGDEVKKGDIIGTVGNTGFSTGPHLHYSVSIYNEYINPYQSLSGIID